MVPLHPSKQSSSDESSSKMPTVQPKSFNRISHNRHVHLRLRRQPHHPVHSNSKHSNQLHQLHLRNQTAPKRSRSSVVPTGRLACAVSTLASSLFRQPMENCMFLVLLPVRWKDFSSCTINDVSFLSRRPLAAGRNDGVPMLTFCVFLLSLLKDRTPLASKLLPQRSARKSSPRWLLELVPLPVVPLRPAVAMWCRPAQQPPR